MQPTRPATATIATALALFLLANLAVAALHQRSPESFADWGTNGAAVKVRQVAAFSGVADVVILGDSTVETGLIPRVLVSGSGECLNTVYNAALAGTNADTWRTWYAEQASSLEPSVVLVGVGKQNLRGNWGAAALDRYLHSRSRLEARGRQSAVLPWIGNLPLIRFRKTLSNPTALLNALRGCGLCEVESSWTAAGWRRNIADRDFWVPPPGWTQQWERNQVLDSSAIPDLRALLAEARSRQAEPVLLRMPDLELSHPISADPAGDEAVFSGLLRTLATEEQVVVLDASALDWSEEGFVDPHHLNGEGARRLSRWVGEQLSALVPSCEAGGEGSR